MAYFWPKAMFTVGAARSADEGDTETWGRAAVKFFPIMLLVGLVLGGLYSGLFTPNEAGAVGGAGALANALVRRRRTWSKLWSVLRETGDGTTSVRIRIVEATDKSRKSGRAHGGNPD